LCSPSASSIEEDWLRMDLALTVDIYQAI